MELLFKECILRDYIGCSQYSKLADYNNPIITTVKKGKGKPNAKVKQSIIKRRVSKQIS